MHNRWSEKQTDLRYRENVNSRISESSKKYTRHTRRIVHTFSDSGNNRTIMDDFDCRY